MNIMFFPQIANRSYSTGKWFLLKDGHIRMVKNQILAINKYSKDNNYIVCIPSQEERMEEKFFIYDLPLEIRMKVIPYIFSFSKNVALNRFHFDMNKLIYDLQSPYKEKTILNDVDIIFNDVPELARNFRTFYRIVQKRDIKIISNIHYIDIYPENQITGKSNYFWRQIDGIECSDKVTFLTKKMMEDFYTYAKDYLHPKQIQEFQEKSVPLDYMLFSESELNTRKIEKSSEKLITFISRCSDDKRTKWKEFIEAVKKLREKRQDFSVFMTNPTDIPLDQLESAIGNGNDFIKYPTKSMTRDDYIELLWRSTAIPLLYDIGNNLSVGFYEAIYCDNIPVQFNKDFGDIRVLDLALDNALDDNLEKYETRKNETIRNGSCEYNAERFYKEFLEC